MNIIEAIIMGVIQGLAEFLPISSSGHLAIFRQILNLKLDQGILFEVLLHFGTLIAIFIVYWHEILALIIHGIALIGRLFQALFGKIEWKQVIDTKEQRFVVMVLITMIPTMIIGLALKNMVENAYETLLIPGIGLFITAGILLITIRLKEGDLDETNAKYSTALMVGVAQGLAVFPGLSRSGSTIVAGKSMKFDKEFATRFSFIMSIPAVLGANVLSLLEADFNTITSSDWLTYGIGVIFSAGVGYVCIRTLLNIIRKNKLHYFAYYCMFAGGLSLFTYFLA